MARRFTLAPTTGRTRIGPRGTAVVAVLAIAFIAKACGDSKPRVDAITHDDAGPAITEAPAVPVAAASTPIPVPPAVSGPVSFADGETAYRERRYEDAVGMFGAYVQQRPDNAWGHYMLGLAAWKSGDADRAVPAFEQALAKDSTHRKALLNLGRVLIEMGKPEDALTRAQQAVAVDSAWAEAWRLQGRALSDLRRADEAVAAYRRAIVLDAGDGWSMNNLGVLHIGAGRYEAALPPLARAAELAPENAVFQNNLGAALERCGQLTLAAVAYRAAIAGDATYAKAITSLARVEGLKERLDLVPVDLATLSRVFTDDVQRWKLEVAGPADSATATVGVKP
jgi:Flp pilus assembly protein TadD